MTPEPVPEPVVEPVPEPTPEPVPEPVADSEFAGAQQAIADAEAVDADRWSPELMKAARKALEDAKAKASSDPDAARALLKLAEDTAAQAREASLAARLQDAKDRLAKGSDALKALKAAQWRPEETNELEARRAAAEAAVEADYEAGLPDVESTLEAMEALRVDLSARLAEAQKLQKAVAAALDEADRADAYVWVPDQVQEASDTFFEGSTFYKKFQLDKAEERWTAALFLAESATAKAIRELARKQTEELMYDTMRKLEGASGKTVVDPQDNIIAPQPWSGNEQLKNLGKPQSRLSAPPMVLIPFDGSTVVLADKQRVTFLDEAKAAWLRGVEAMNAEDFPLANQEFLHSQNLINEYLALAIDKFYTVRLLPDRRDSLWRISDYEGIYGSPWDWPKIWKRNQKLIQNPDLIYPGWQLIIPPQ